MKNKSCLFLGLLLLTSCAEVKPHAPKEGRIAVYETTAELAPTSQIKITLDKPGTISSWTGPNYNAKNRRPTGDITPDFRLACTVKLDDYASDDAWALAEPVYHKGIIYTLSSGYKLVAVRLKDCKKIWSVSLPVQTKGLAAKAIGLTLAQKTLFATTGEGLLFAVDLNGRILGQKDFKTPIRSAPIAYQDNLYITTSDNQILVVKIADGKKSWNYQTLHAGTSFFGMAPAAADKDMLVVPFSNGDVSTFDATTGTPIWEESFLAPSISNRTMDFSHVLASPVIEDTVVYVVTNARQTAAFNLSTGRKLWEAPISGQSTPALSGNALFIVSNDEYVLALDKKTGQVIWQKDLAIDTKRQHVWKGPLVFGDKLVVISADGKGVILNALTGDTLRTFKTRAGMSAPIFADKAMVLLVNHSYLLIYR